jgi:hypothetical protein
MTVISAPTVMTYMSSNVNRTFVTFEECPPKTRAAAPLCAGYWKSFKHPNASPVATIVLRDWK